MSVPESNTIRLQSYLFHKVSVGLLLSLVFGILFLTCSRPSEPQLKNPYDEKSDAFIATPGLSTVEVSSIDVPTAISGGQFTNEYGYEVSSKGVCWSEEKNPTLNDECTDEGGGKEDFTSRLEPIEYNSTYFVRAYATNQEGTVYANQQQFKTRNTYELTVSITGEGTVEEKVIEEPAKTEYPEETVVELTAIPGDGWKFDHWEEDLSGSDNPERLTINETKVVTAVFKRQNFELTINIEGEGTVEETIIEEPEKTPYPGGTVVELTATPSDEWTFDHWEEDLSGSNNPEQLTIDEAKVVTAVFKHQNFELTINIEGEGTVEETIIEEPEKNPYPSGTVVELTAIPSDGWKFDHWDEDLSGNSNPEQIIMNEPKKVHAVFQNLIKWKFQTDGQLWSSPAIASDGTVYIGGFDNHLYAINQDGSQKWKYQTNQYITSSPAVSSNGTIYVGSAYDYTYAINPDGTLKWRFKSGAVEYSSPAIASDGTIYIGSLDHNLYAINPDGSQKWKFKTGHVIDSSPAIASNGTIYVSSYDQYLYAVKPNGSQKWKFYTGGGKFHPIIDEDGTIYIGSFNNYLNAINPDGSLKWKFKTNSFENTSPAIAPDRTIYVASDFYLYAIRPNGTQKWIFRTNSNIQSSPAIAADGTIYLGTLDNYIYAINSDGTRKWRIESGLNVRSSPVISPDGTIYIGSSDKYLYAIEGENSGPANSPWPMFGQNAQRTGRQPD